MNFKFYVPFSKAQQQGKPEKGFFVEGYAATSDPDRQGDIILLEALEKAITDLDENTTVFFNHLTENKPIGKIVDKKVIRDPDGRTGKLWVKVYISETAKDIQKLIEEGILNKFSISGIIPETAIKEIYNEEGEVVAREISDMEIWEVSLVGLPANTKARTIGYQIVKSLKLDEKDKKEEKTMVELKKKAVPPHETAKADEDTPWDGNKARMNLRKWASSDGSGDPDKIDWDKYAKGFAWYDESIKDQLGAYKLPHHDIIDGEFKVVWGGVAAAMAALFGARGGVDIPESEAKAVYDHLVVHYKQFGKTPPEWAAWSAKPEEEKTQKQVDQTETETKQEGQETMEKTQEQSQQQGEEAEKKETLAKPLALILAKENASRVLGDLSNYKVGDKITIKAEAEISTLDLENNRVVLILRDVSKLEPAPTPEKSSKMEELEQTVKQLQQQIEELKKQDTVDVESLKKQIEEDIIQKVRVVKTRKGLILQKDLVEHEAKSQPNVESGDNNPDSESDEEDDLEILKDEEKFNKMPVEKQRQLISKALLKTFLRK